MTTAYPGAVMRFDWDGSTWNRMNWSGVQKNVESFGLSLDASDDCSVIVVGAPMNNNTTGTFHIYTWDGTEYVERLSADTHGTKQASEVAVSGDGNVVAVGGLFLNPSHIKVYQRNSDGTFGLKYTINSDQSSGTSVALNSDGSLSPWPQADGAHRVRSTSINGRHPIIRIIKVLMGWEISITWAAVI